MRKFFPRYNLLIADNAVNQHTLLIITDGWIEDRLLIRHKHAFLLPEGHRLPFHPRGEVFYFKE